MSTLTSPGATRRVRALTRANTTLMMRNKLTLIYAVVMPLIPLALLATTGDDVDAAATAIGSVALLALMFPVFYNMLSLFVTRRDELVLKRMRTGEARDAELLTSIALPGVAVAVVVMVAAVAVAAGFGLPLPTNPLVYLVSVLAGCVIFTGLALATAAFTRTSEAAQITSFPVIVLAVAGSLVDVYPARVAEVMAFTPTAAINKLIEVSWFARSEGTDLSFAQTFTESAEPLLILVLWSAVAVTVARRYLRWEPRT